MGLEIAKAFVTVRGDVGRVAGDIVAGKPQVMQAATALQSTVNRILAGIGVGLSVAGIISEFRQGIGLAERQIDAEARMAAVIKGTGMAAGYTADQLKTMASEMQKITTVGDEEILESMAILLTFKSVTGSVFESAMDTMLDMSAVMGTSARGAAMQLGRALEDPIRGVSALRRTGVSFSEEQKKYIKLLVESNKLSEAQAYVLSVVRGQLGDVAEALAQTPSGQLKQARNVLGDLREELGKRLIPVQIKLIELQQLFIKGLTKVVDFVGQYRDQIATVGKVVLMVTAVLLGMKVVMMAVGTAVAVLKGALMLVVSPLGLLAVGLTVLAVKFKVFDDFGKKLAWLEARAPIAIRVVSNAFHDLRQKVVSFGDAMRDMLASSSRWSEFASGVISGFERLIGWFRRVGGILDLMFGSWEGFQRGLGQLWAQLAVAFEKLWAYVTFAFKAGWAKFLPVVLSKYADLLERLARATPFGIFEERLRQSAAKLRIGVSALDLGIPEIVRTYREELTGTLDELEARSKSLYETLLSETKELPRLSGILMEAWRRAKEEIKRERVQDWLMGKLGQAIEGAMSVLEELTSAKEAAEEGARAEKEGISGRFGFAEYGKHIQDALLKTKGPAEETAKNTEDIAKNTADTATAVENLGDRLGQSVTPQVVASAVEKFDQLKGALGRGVADALEKLPTMLLPIGGKRGTPLPLAEPIDQGMKEASRNMERWNDLFTVKPVRMAEEKPTKVTEVPANVFAVPGRLPEMRLVPVEKMDTFAKDLSEYIEQELGAVSEKIERQARVAPPEREEAPSRQISGRVFDTEEWNKMGRRILWRGLFGQSMEGAWTDRLKQAALGSTTSAVGFPQKTAVEAWKIGFEEISGLAFPPGPPATAVEKQLPELQKQTKLLDEMPNRIAKAVNRNTAVYAE